MYEGLIVRMNPGELHIRDSSWFQVLNAGPTSVGAIQSLNDWQEKLD